MKKSRKEKSKELAEFWKAHIDKWSNSGLTQTKYCLQKDLSRDRFTYWKRKFKQQNLPVEFVQLTPQSMDIGQAGLKLNIGSALQLEIPDGFSRATLEQVLKTLNVV